MDFSRDARRAAGDADRWRAGWNGPSRTGMVGDESFLQGPASAPRRHTGALVFWSKAAKALSTRPAKGVTFAGLVLWSKAAKALSTRPAKGVTFAGLRSANLICRGSNRISQTMTSA